MAATSLEGKELLSGNAIDRDRAARALGERLRILRERAGMTTRDAVSQVRDHTGHSLTSTELAGIEDGNLRRLTLHTLDAFGELFGMSPQSLLSGLTVGQRAWLLRRSRGMTQGELAAALSEYTGEVRSRQYISKLEKDDLAGSVGTARLRALARIFDRPLGFLTGDDDGTNDAQRELLKALRELKTGGARELHVRHLATSNPAEDLLELAGAVRAARADLDGDDIRLGATTFQPGRHLA